MKHWQAISLPILSLTISLFLVGCFSSSSDDDSSTTSTDSSDSSTTTSTSTSGIALPAEISAVQAKDEDDTTAILAPDGYIGMASAIKSYTKKHKYVGVKRKAYTLKAVEDIPTDSDYHTVTVKKFVEIKSLDVFDIVEQIFDAFAQTNYTDEVGNGWYSAIVLWEEDAEGGTTTTNQQRWALNSTMVSENGTDINRVFFILEEIEHGETEIIRGQLDISEAPTENTDGTLADLGVWEIDVAFGVDQSDPDYFQANASKVNGLAKVIIEDRFTEDEGEISFDGSTQAVIYRGADSGYGKINQPDWESCFSFGGPGDGGGDGDGDGGGDGDGEGGGDGDGEGGGDGDGDHGGGFAENCPNGPPLIAIKFAYNEHYLTVQVEDENPQSFDRNDEHELVHRYKLFDADDGHDIEKDFTFGMPIVQVDAQGDEQAGQWGWYGAWQDRHEVWKGGSQASDGDRFKRDSFGNEEEDDTIYVAENFSGSLSKIELAQGDTEQLLDKAVEIYINNHIQVRWVAANSEWHSATAWDEFGHPTTFEDYTSQMDILDPSTTGEGSQKWIWCDHWDNNSQQMVFLVWSTADSEFKVATQGQFGLEATQTAFAPNDDDEVWCNIGGQSYIEYTGDFDGPTTTTGWVEKSLESFDNQTWTPTFGNQDIEFDFELGREYFINDKGANLRVTRVAENGQEADYQVYMEVQTVAKPVSDLSDVYPANTILVDGWNPEGSSTFNLVTDSSDSNYLLLEYATVSEQDQNDGISAGDLCTQDLWGLRIQGTEDNPIGLDTIMYNYEYQSDNDFWGAVTYLKNETTDAYLLVSSPLRFNAIQLASTNDIVNAVPEDDWLSYALGFDGHLFGLPDTWWSLALANFDPNEVPSVLAKNVRIPDGTELTESTSGETYLIKAIDSGIFLGFVTDFPLGSQPDITLGDGIVLEDEIDDFDIPGSSVPTEVPSETEAPVKYVEGIPVDDE